LTRLGGQGSGDTFTVDLPAGVEILDSRGDLIVTTSVDPLDRPSIQVLSLRAAKTGALPDDALRLDPDAAPVDGPSLEQQPPCPGRSSYPMDCRQVWSWPSGV
jgi:hypothetical protein